MAELTRTEASVAVTATDRWDGGAVFSVDLTAQRPIADWRVTLDAGGTITEVWNARIVETRGTLYTLAAADYNAKVQAGAAIEFGFKVEGEEVVGAASLSLIDVDTDLAADVALESAREDRGLEDGTVSDGAGGSTGDDGGAADRPERAETPTGGDAPTKAAAPSAGTTPRVTEVPEDSVAEPIAISVTGAAAREPEGDPSLPPGRGFAPGPLSTRGTAIVDADGAPAPLHGINWFGFETETFAPHGLWARNWRELMDEARSFGFNALRVPFSGELVASDGGRPSSIDPTLNPDLVGLHGLEILDAIVAYAHDIGLAVLLDYHRGAPGSGPNPSGLWYGDGRTEADVVAEWSAMARRYADAPAVIGADLINEPFLATWGDGSATDWPAAAERLGNAIHTIAPHWLIIVEGNAVHDGHAYWWGGNLRGVEERPVQLDQPDKLVYSAHDYPPSVHPQAWFFDGSDLAATFDDNWGFVRSDGHAPLLLGEWGSRLEDPLDRDWADALARYITRHDLPWMWWSLNPNSANTGGLYASDWTTVRPEVTELLSPLVAATRPTTRFDEADFGAQSVFTIALEEAADAEVSLNYATVDGTAKAGLDYVATAGTLRFREGESEKRVAVELLPDGRAEGNEFFTLAVGSAGVVRGSGIAVIADNEAARRAAAQPLVDVAGTVVPEVSGTARFDIVLSRPAPHDVTVTYAVRPDSADGSDLTVVEGSVVIASGSHRAAVDVPLDDDEVPERAERFTLELTGAEGAAIRTGSATGTIAAEPPGLVTMAEASATEGTALTIDLILQNDWGDGALFNVEVHNASDAPVSGWQLAFDVPFDIAELWSAVLLEDAGERVTVANADWNGGIEPGETVKFGFVADAGNIALGALAAAADLEIAIE